MQRPSWLRELTPVDGLAALIALAALSGVVWSPKLTNAVAQATGAIQPIRVSVDVRHLMAADPEGLMDAIREEGEVSLVIRNQPAGRLKLIGVEQFKSRLFSVLADGDVVQADYPDPSIPVHARFLLEASGEAKPSGVVVGGTKLKIGTPIELEGRLYRVNGTVSGVQLL